MLSKRERVASLLSGYLPLLKDDLADKIDAIYAEPDELNPVKIPKYSVSQVDGVWWHHQWHRKDIYSDPISKDDKVPQENIDWLWNLICEKWEVPPNPFDVMSAIEYKYRWQLPQLSREIVIRKNLQIPITSFNGGGTYNRVNYHHLYIYPFHVLAHMKRIRFGRSSWRLI